MSPPGNLVVFGVARRLQVICLPVTWFARVVSDRDTLKVGGDETGGALVLLEALAPPGGEPPHIHHRKDESFYVLEGELTFEADGQQCTAAPGSRWREACFIGSRISALISPPNRFPAPKLSCVCSMAASL